ncbi:MAG: guanylate kinase [Clostridiales bacterium]|nr:guanylate kinase [Clostridiales bacterium]
MAQKGLLTVVSGFSGAGKGTLMKRLLEKYPESYALSVSATTRRPREGEVDGREYFFVSVEEFERMIREDELIEHARYVSNYYGTPRRYVTEQMEAGRDVLLEIEVQGALLVKEKYPDALLLFVTPPSAQELERRLRGRETETEEVIRRRMRQAVTESKAIDCYDSILVNDDLETCVDEMHALLRSRHYAVERNAEFIRRMRQELAGRQDEQTDPE